MEFLYDWKLWLFAVTLIGILINWLANQKLANNDLHHISIDIKDIQKDVKDLATKVINIDKEVAVQGAKIEDLEKTIK